MGAVIFWTIVIVFLFIYSKNKPKNQNKETEERVEESKEKTVAVDEIKKILTYHLKF